MAMPAELVLVRHGQSEANVVQAERKADKNAIAPEGFHDRHDSRMRLTPEGRQQAMAAGAWLTEHFPEGFDSYYTSTLVRTMETAGRLGIHGAWVKDDRWRERDWGEYGILSEAEQEDVYKLSHRLKGQNRWYWCPPGGESLATGVRSRFEDILDSLHREEADKRMIVVTHGEMIDVARFVLERMTPEEWLVDNKDPSRKIKNCQILHYTRRDPETGELASRMNRMRSICPWDETYSWEGGDWIPIMPRRKYSDEELLSSVEAFPPLLGEPEELHA